MIPYPAAKCKRDAKITNGKFYTIYTFYTVKSRPCFSV